MECTTLEKIYLKMLYTDNLTNEIDTEEYKYFLKNHDPERLAVERAARQRNLRTVLYNDMTLINSYLDKNALLEHVLKYCSDFFFNNSSGRSLVENFCFYMYLHNDQSELIKIRYKVQGVYSGICTNSNIPSPWPNHRVAQEDNTIHEIFDIPLRLNASYFSTQNKGVETSPKKIQTECTISKNESNVLMKFMEKS